MLCIFCLVLAALSDGRVMELEIDSNAVDGHARRCSHINAVQSVMSNSTVFVTDMKTSRLLSILVGNISCDVGPRVSLMCPEGQTVTIEVVPSVDDGHQLILRSWHLHILVAVRLALLHRLEVRSQTWTHDYYTLCISDVNKTKFLRPRPK